MKVHTQNKTSTLGDWAALALDKHFHKVLKHEDDVLKDKDPEALHQMRVGMRRLRSAITGFTPALDLPKLAQEKRIGKIAHTLGTLRDLDVLGAALQNQYKPALPAEEQEYLENALDYLNKQRRQASAQVKDTLEHKRYQSFKQSLKQWLKQPIYQEVAQMPIEQVLPDLLLPEVSKLLLHPGWLVGTDIKQGEIEVLEESPEKVEQLLADQGEVLHSLRKATKRIRYQMEVFSDFYGSSYQAYLNDMKTIQEILGQIQDSFVLAEFLTAALQSKIKNSLPTLAHQLAQTRYPAWQKWQTLQQRYLNLEIRKGFHSAILHPTFEQISDGKSPENDLTLSPQT
ncbi:CHAD domain-containing protein [Chroococcidiopsis sp. CCMEE 29]|uniref:CHAD domain-containing protein n=1 Tax=Chroococcidiopsis sp. CCMEE 29 TaxID=155894 RepID=UPI0020218D51|nr:CHAD domain-containing protein [Chroococcidiopsis sp. CCMEE 29]